uniref:Doublecortin domain-containing protein n=3 Tax=Caenorhabditis TaxID=6237 RepID=A0A1I7TIX3_9PELO
MQLYYDRPTSNGKTINLDEPIPDGGFISKRIFNAAPITQIENPSRPGPIKEYRKLWIVLIFKTTNPFGRVYILSTKDLHSKYRSVTDFLKSDTGNMLGTPVAGTYFYLTTD